MDITITGQASNGKFRKTFQTPLAIGPVALAYLVVNGAVVEFPATSPVTVYILENPGDVEVKANETLTYTLHTLPADAKNYTDFRDVLANIKRKNEDFNVYLDFGPQGDSRTFVATWGIHESVATLLVEPGLGRKLGGRPFDYTALQTPPSGATVALPQIPPGLYDIGCSHEKVIHIRPRPVQAAAVKLLVTNTTLVNCITPRDPVENCHILLAQNLVKNRHTLHLQSGLEL